MKKNKELIVQKKRTIKQIWKLRRRKWENILEQMDFVVRQIKF